MQTGLVCAAVRARTGPKTPNPEPSGTKKGTSALISLSGAVEWRGCYAFHNRLFDFSTAGTQESDRVAATYSR